MLRSESRFKFYWRDSRNIILGNPESLSLSASESFLLVSVDSEYDSSSGLRTFLILPCEVKESPVFGGFEHQEGEPFCLPNIGKK